MLRIVILLGLAITILADLTTRNGHYRNHKDAFIARGQVNSLLAQALRFDDLSGGHDSSFNNAHEALEGDDDEEEVRLDARMLSKLAGKFTGVMKAAVHHGKTPDTGRDVLESFHDQYTKDKATVHNTGWQDRPRAVVWSSLRSDRRPYNSYRDRTSTLPFGQPARKDRHGYPIHDSATLAQVYAGDDKPRFQTGSHQTPLILPSRGRSMSQRRPSISGSTNNPPQRMSSQRRPTTEIPIIQPSRGRSSSQRRPSTYEPAYQTLQRASSLRRPSGEIPIIQPSRGRSTSQRRPLTGGSTTRYEGSLGLGRSETIQYPMLHRPSTRRTGPSSYREPRVETIAPERSRSTRRRG